jgi:hypothetical protein
MKYKLIVSFNKLSKPYLIRYLVLNRKLDLENINEKLSSEDITIRKMTLEYVYSNTNKISSIIESDISWLSEYKSKLENE